MPKTAKKLWTEEEDARLKQAVQIYNAKKWKEISKYVGTKDPYSCYQHYFRVLNPKISRAKWTETDYYRLVYLIRTFGRTAWSAISKHMICRTDIMCRTKFLEIQRAGNTFTKQLKDLLDHGTLQDVEEFLETQGYSFHHEIKMAIEEEHRQALLQQQLEEQEAAMDLDPNNNSANGRNMRNRGKLNKLKPTRQTSTDSLKNVMAGVAPTLAAAAALSGSMMPNLYPNPLELTPMAGMSLAMMLPKMMHQRSLNGQVNSDSLAMLQSLAHANSINNFNRTQQAFAAQRAAAPQQSPACSTIPFRQQSHLLTGSSGLNSELKAEKSELAPLQPLPLAKTVGNRSDSITSLNANSARLPSLFDSRRSISSRQGSMDLSALLNPQFRSGEDGLPFVPSLDDIRRGSFTSSDRTLLPLSPPHPGTLAASVNDNDLRRRTSQASLSMSPLPGLSDLSNDPSRRSSYCLFGPLDAFAQRDESLLRRLSFVDLRQKMDADSNNSSLSDVEMKARLL